MRKFCSLTKALMKNNFNFVADGKGGKAKTMALYIFLAICMFPLVAVLYMMFATYFEAYGSFSQTGTVLAIGFFLTAFLVFFFSLFVIPGVFYFSKDNDILLCLPLQPHTILAAKFVNCLIYDLLFSCIVIIPLGIAYAQNMPFGIWELVCFIIIALSLPIIPLIYSSIVTMIIMRFVPFVKNKDAFNMISGIIIVVISLGFSTYLNSLSSVDQVSLISMLMEGNNSMIALFTTLFPFLANASYMIFDASILQFVMYIAWNIGFIALFLVIGKLIYFKGAIGINESGSSSRRIDLRKNTHHTPIFKAYARKELKLLLRTPAYFLNCIMSIIIVPFMMLIISIQPEIRGLMTSSLIHEMLSISGISYYIILGILIFSCMIGPMNMIASTAISREGDHVSFMKFIPVPYETQLYAKAVIGILLGIVGMLPLWGVVMYLLDFPMMLSIVSLLAIILSNIALSLVGIIIDTMRPKLIWEQEASAVKQNLNGMLEMLAGILFIVFIGTGLFLIPADMLMYFTMAVMMIFVMIIAICYVILHRCAGKMFEKIS